MALRWNKNWQGIWISLPIRRMPDTIFLKLYRIKQIIRKCFVVDCFLITSTCPPLDHIGPGTRLAVAIFIMTSVSKIHSFLGYLCGLTFLLSLCRWRFLYIGCSVVRCLRDIVLKHNTRSYSGASHAVCVTWPPCRESIWRLLGAISRFIDKMQFGSLLPLFFLILFYSFY